MIKNIRHAGIRKFFHTGISDGINEGHIQELRYLLASLNAAKRLSDMDLPGWELRHIEADLDDYSALKIHGNWYITFAFQAGYINVFDCIELE